MQVSEFKPVQPEGTFKDSQEFNSNLLLNSPHPVLVVNPDTSIRYVNPALEKLTGYINEELIGRKTPYPWWPRRTFRRYNMELKQAMRGSATNIERVFQNRNSKKFWVDVISTPVKESGKFSYQLINWVNTTEKKQIEQRLKRSNEQLRYLSLHLQSIREEERKRIARQIHDELGQALTAIKMNVCLLGESLNIDQTALINKAESISKYIDVTLQTVKSIYTELRPGVLDELGLVAAIEWLSEQFQETTGIVCKVVSRLEDTIDRGRSITIFRIFQQALTNIYQHSNANEVTVNLQQKYNELVLIVHDNGKGITKDQITNPKAFGLIGIRERTRAWGGEVKIRGIPNNGTTILVKIPIGREKDDKDTSC